MPPRIRTIKPEHRQHRKIGPLGDMTYRVWVGLILESDDEGRFVSEPPQLWAAILPYRRFKGRDMSRALRQLHDLGLIQLDEVGGVQYGCFPSWSEHQRIHKHHFTPSKLPIPPVKSEEVPYQYRTGTVPVPQDRKGMEGKGMDRKGGESEGRESDPASALHGAPARPQEPRQANPDTTPESIEGTVQSFMATLRRVTAGPLDHIPPPRPARGFRGADPDPPPPRNGHHPDEVAI
jgi:hypothetical protein